MGPLGQIPKGVVRVMDKSELSAADPGRRRLAAIVALVVGAATIVLAVVLAVTEFPRGLGLLACVVVAGAAAWFGRAAAGDRARGGAGRGGPGARRRGGAGGHGWVAARRCARHRRAPRVSGGGARDACRPRGVAAGAEAAATGALLQHALGWRKSRAVRGRQGGTGAGDRADRAQAGRRPGDAGPRGGRSRRRCARDGRRRRLAGDRRGDGGRAWFAVRVHPRRNAQPLRPRPRRRPRRRRRARSTRSSTVASARWTWPRSTGACSSTTSRSGSMPRRSSTRATATPSYARCSTPCRTCSGPRVKVSTCAGPGRTGTRVVPER